MSADTGPAGTWPFRPTLCSSARPSLCAPVMTQQQGMHATAGTGPCQDRVQIRHTIPAQGARHALNCAYSAHPHKGAHALCSAPYFCVLRGSTRSSSAQERGLCVILYVRAQGAESEPAKAGGRWHHQALPCSPTAPDTDTGSISGPAALHGYPQPRPHPANEHINQQTHVDIKSR